MTAIAPSILAADFSRLGDLVREVDAAGADRIHIDVMDGHFVPNLSMGSVVVKGLRPVTTKPLEVHLMVQEPRRYFQGFVDAGADTLIVHLEVLPDPLPALREIKSLGKKAGLAINPDMPVARLEPFLGETDLALCMTVFPGFGGQAFLPDSPGRVRELKGLINRRNPACELEVDGGIGLDQAAECHTAGADVFVAGTSVFGHGAGPTAAVREMLARLGS